jgi:hypothetical protein
VGEGCFREKNQSLLGDTWLKVSYNIDKSNINYFTNYHPSPQFVRNFVIKIEHLLFFFFYDACAVWNFLLLFILVSMSVLKF